MNESNPESVSDAGGLSYSSWLFALGTAITAICVAVLWISDDFGPEQPRVDRPTILFLSLMAAASVCYYASIVVALRTRDTLRLRNVIWGFAIACRLALLPSTPIHEVDLHRYIWDGAVVNAGVSPYRYPPGAVIEAAALGEAPGTDPQLERLVEAQAKSDSLRASLKRVHFEWLPSPYPPVSQAVFALADASTPDAARPRLRITVLKAWIVACDLATLWVVFALLQHCTMHSGWAVVYAWCPLVLKEFANSGHLDAIAVLLTCLALLLLVRSWSGDRLRASPFRSTLPAAFVLALGIGAKLYPLVLLPLFAAYWLCRGDWKAAASGLFTCGVMTAVLLRPLFALGGQEAPEGETIVLTPPSAATPIQATTPAHPLAKEFASVTNDSAAGLRAFLQSWEMNDLLFMLVLENLRPHNEQPPHERPWFAVVPDDWVLRVTDTYRSVLAQSPFDFSERERLDDRRVSFLLARTATGLATALLACLFAWRGTRGDAPPEQILRAAALTIAWFWMLCPTQNPWYWCWVVPFLPFVRLRTWHATTSLVILYYIRFWLAVHFGETIVSGSPYFGSNFFHFVVAPIEHGVVLLALLVESTWLMIASARAGRLAVT